MYDSIKKLYKDVCIKDNHALNLHLVEIFNAHIIIDSGTLWILIAAIKRKKNSDKKKNKKYFVKIVYLWNRTNERTHTQEEKKHCNHTMSSDQSFAFRLFRFEQMTHTIARAIINSID